MKKLIPTFFGLDGLKSQFFLSYNMWKIMHFVATWVIYILFDMENYKDKEKEPSQGLIWKYSLKFAAIVLKKENQFQFQAVFPEGLH